MSMRGSRYGGMSYEHNRKAVVSPGMNVDAEYAP